MKQSKSVKPDQGKDPEQFGYGSVAYEYFRAWAFNPKSAIQEVKEWYLRKNINDIRLVWQKP